MITEKDLIARVRALQQHSLRTWIDRGWVKPLRRGRSHAFSEVDVARVELICELRYDLKVDEEALPVVLSLLDQVYGLREALKVFASAVDEQPAEVRERIRARIRALLPEAKEPKA